MLATPQGQIICVATRSLLDEDEAGPSRLTGDSTIDAENERETKDGGRVEADTSAENKAGEDGLVNGEMDQDDEDAEDEPWLEEPERQRLLLGLASQWNEDDSPRIECEVSLLLADKTEHHTRTQCEPYRCSFQLGRLYIRNIMLPPAEPPNVGVPLIRPPPVTNILLILNGSIETPWSDLALEVG